MSIAFGGLETEEHGISLFALSTALHTSICELPTRHPLFPQGTYQHTANEGFAIDAAIDAEGVHADTYVDAATEEEQSEANLLNMIWILCENGIYQGDFVYKLVNQLVLTGLVGFRNLQANDAHTQRLFNSQLGISAYDYFLSLFGLWAMAGEHGNINSTRLIAPGPRKAQLDNSCRLVMNELSLRHSDYGTKIQQTPYNTYDGKSLPMAIFSRWPLINLNDEIYAFANQKFMQIQLSSKLLTKALALARIDEGIPDTRYSQLMGTDRLEPFFGELCEIWNPKGGHFAEYVYDRRNNSKSPDRIAFEKHGTSTVVHLFQLKLKSLKEASHYGIAIDPVLNDLKGAFARLLSQSIKFLYSLKRSHEANTLRAEHEELSRKILAGDRYCLWGIVPDLPSVFVFKLLRDRVMEEVEAALSAQEMQWYEQHLKGKFIWHIMELPEFQIFITLPQQHRDLYKAFTKYLRDSQIERLVLDEAGNMPSNFRSYLIRKFGPERNEDGSRRIKILQEDLYALYEQSLEDINQFFFGTNAQPTP